jgi:hypothetical protein
MVSDNSSYSNQEWQTVDIRDGEAYFEIRNLLPTHLRIYVGDQRIERELDGPIDDLVIDLAAEKKPEDLEPGEGTTTRTVVYQFKTPAGEPVLEGEFTATYRREERGQFYMERERLPIKDGRAEFVVTVPNRVGYKSDGLVGYWIKEDWGEEVTEGNDPFVLEVAALPAGAIYGNVKDPDGSPATATFIDVVLAERPEDMPQGSLGVEIKNSAGGEDDEVSKFIAAPLPLGGKYAMVLHRKQTYVMSEPIHLTEKNPIQEIDLQYVEGITVRGRVVTPDGKPATAKKFRLNFSSGYSHGFGGSELYTGAEGQFELEHVNPETPGTYRLTFSENKGFRPKTIEFDPKDSPLEIILEPAVELRGVVIDQETGWPVQGIEVYAIAANQEEREPTGYIDANSETNERGEFVFTEVGPIEYNLGVRGGNIVGDERAVGGKDEPVTVTVKLSGNRSDNAPRPVKPKGEDR